MFGKGKGRGKVSKGGRTQEVEKLTKKDFTKRGKQKRFGYNIDSKGRERRTSRKPPAGKARHKTEVL